MKGHEWMQESSKLFCRSRHKIIETELDRRGRNGEKSCIYANVDHYKQTFCRVCD